MEYAVEVKDVSKRFKLYHENVRSLKEKVLFFRSRGYEEFWALKDVSFSVGKGRSLGIIGANGSGKTTMLKCMTKILFPTNGEIITHGTNAALLELGAGFQPDLTGRENIFLNGSILGLSRKEVEKRFDDIVAFAELEQVIDNHVRNYSSGMFVRLGFAIAINVDPDILIIDEVLAVGDEAFQRKCLEKIDSIRESGRTIIFVTHNVDVTKEICDYVVMLDHGKIIKEGDPKDVVNFYHAFMEKEGEARERGTKEIAVKEIRVLDTQGQLCKQFTTGDGMRLQVIYEAHEPVEDPVFGFSLEDYRGFTCFGTNTKLKGLEMGTVRGEGMLEFDLKSLPMLDGKFTVSAAIHSRNEQTIYHWVENKSSFMVQSHEADAGIFYIPCEVHMHSGDVPPPPVNSLGGE